MPFDRLFCKASRQAAELGSDAVSVNGPLNDDGTHDNDGRETGNHRREHTAEISRKGELVSYIV